VFSQQSKLWAEYRILVLEVNCVLLQICEPQARLSALKKCWRAINIAIYLLRYWYGTVGLTLSVINFRMTSNSSR
jgi:hypothetical protein